MSPRFSDEHLNAYLDNQLDAEERSLLLDELRRDRELAARVCKLQKVQDMVQLAYHNVANEHEVQNRHLPRWQRHIAQAASALLILGLGLTVGWVSHDALNHPTSLIELAQSAQFASQPKADDELKLMLHVNSGDPGRLQTVLDETEYLLRTSNKNGRKIQIEILTNGEGLALLRKGNPTYTQKVRSLSSEYKNVRFMACRIAINRYEHEQGVKIQLLPDTEVVPSAMHQALQRQQEGWAYLRI